jgi:hypothetical protein
MELSSIVIIAKDFNPSIFKPPWLTKNNIFREEELQANILIAPPVVQIPTENFQFTVLPDRLQMLIPKQYSDAEGDIDRVLGRIVRILPHTPYTAVGLNFNYLIAPDTEAKFSAWNRKVFASALSRKLPSPRDRNARFGSYVSFDVLETRLKVDIKPIKADANIKAIFQSWHEDQDLIRLNFNFHSDVVNTDAPVDSVLDKLSKWGEALALSQQLTAIISE